MSNQQVHDQLNRHLSYLNQDENNLNLLVQISDLYLELNDIETAQTYLDKASTIDREACLGHQGFLHLNQGQLTQAQDNFREALSHVDTPELRYNLGFTHFMNSELDMAMEVLSPLLNEEPSPEAKLLIVRILHAQGELEQALDLVQSILTHNPMNEEAMGLLALLYFDVDQGELAFQACRNALALNPDNYDAQLIDVMSRLATQEASTEEVEKLLQRNSNDCRLWFALGSVHMTQGAFDLAEDALTKAVEIYPEFYDCHIALGWCQLINDHIDEALQSYQTAADFFGELADAWGGQALVYALKEDFLKAEQFLQKTKELDSECFLAEIAECIYFNHKNPQQAKEHFIKALKSSKVPVSEKLAFIIEGMQEQDQLH